MIFTRGWALILVALLCSTMSLSVIEISSAGNGTSINVDTPISIFAGFPPFSLENDTALIENASKYGWSGTGGVNDPILIQDILIDGNGTLHGIHIENITLTMSFSNVTVTNISSSQISAGIFVRNSTMVNVIDSNTSNMRNGLRAEDSSISVDNSTFISNTAAGISAYNCSVEINGSLFLRNYRGIDLYLCIPSNITNNNFTSNSDNSILVDRSPSILIENNLIISTTSDGISLYNSDNAIINNNNYFQNSIGIYISNSDYANISNEEHDSDGNGIYVRSSTNTQIIDCEMIDSNNHISFYYSNGGTVLNNELRNGGRGVYIRQSTNVNIIGNNITSSTISGIQLYYGANGAVINNNTINGPPIGINIANAPETIVYNNTISNCLNGIELSGSYSNQLIRNKISSSSEDGIQLSGSYYVTAEDNILKSNSQFGFSWVSSNYGTIRNNTVTGSQTGIEFISCDEGTISGNSFGSVGHGVIFMGSDRGIIENNSVIDTTGFGITLSESNDNSIANNTIMKCRFYGIKMLSSSDNVIFNNALAYNNKARDSFNSSSRQAVDNFDSNEWYKNRSGNYWRDMTGPDVDLNGIVDNQYTLADLVNSDPYPLTTTEFKLVPSIVLDFIGGPIHDTAMFRWDLPMFDGGEPILGFELYRKNSTGKYQSIMELGPSIQAYTDEEVDPGETYSYQISAYNAIGEGPRSNTIQVTPDITKPVITILTPAPGSFINSELVHFTWTGSDPLNNIVEYWVKLDEWDWLKVGLSKEIDYPVVGNGKHNFTVMGIDLAGNSNSSYVEFYIDVEMPTIDIMGLTDGTWTNSSTAFFQWTMNDNHSGIHHIEIRWDDVYWLDKGINTNITIKNLGEGPHIVYFKVIDNAGNEINLAINFTIDLEIPTVWIEYPPSNSIINTSSLWFKWVGFDYESETQTFMVKVDDGSWNDLGIVYNTTVIFEGEGDHIVYLMLIDNAGNRAIKLLNITVDKVRPEIISYGPVGNMIDPYSTMIYVELSENLDPNNMDFKVGDLPGTLTWDTTNRVYFSPNEELRFGTTYEVSISGVDLAGNHLISFKWTFSTDDRGYVKGRLLDTSNFPVKNALITIVDSNSTTPDGAGNFILTSISGPAIVRIEAPGYLPITKNIVIMAGETYDLGPIRLEEKIDRGYIKGKVLDKDGDPLLGVIVTLDTGDTYTTDENGSFEFYVEIGNYTISFERDGFKRNIENAWVTKETTVDLDDILLESTSANEPSENGGLELWQMQLLIFLAIVLAGIIIIFFIMKRSKDERDHIGEE